MASGPQLRRFRRTLTYSIRKEDNAWDYYIPNLPGAAVLDGSGYIKSIKLTSTKMKQEILLSLEPVPQNRVTRSDSPSKFVLVSFADFRLQYGPPDGGIRGNIEAGTVPAPARESGEYIVRLLRAGIKLNGVTYHFYGHSNSQLKSRSCLLYAATKAEISQKIESLGDFSKMKSVGKKAKRIGLMFSSAEVALDRLDPDKCEDIPDIQTKDYIFTDGCGLIAPSLAIILAQKRNIAFRNQKYVPSVFQIRYRGYKGVLMVDPTMKDSKPLVKFRDSMRKFSAGDDSSFSVVAYSRPYSFGNLNDELVLLISSLGVPTETLIRKQQEAFNYFENALTDPQSAFMFLTYMNEISLAERMLLNGIEDVHREINRLLNAEYGKLLNKREAQRCRILIPKSRILFGICDPWGILKSGECAVRVTLGGEGAGRPMTLMNAEILVGRNPCLHPGDVRKLKAVYRKEFDTLRDCIIFPTRGKRPHADMMSGGDLDGDQFFVTWDMDIIPRFMSLPAEYPGGREPIKFERITDDDRLEYFAKYTNASLGRVKNLYLDWARIKGAMSPECQQLNRLFSSCVDGVRIKIPQTLESPPKPEEETEPSEPFILDALHEHSVRFIQNRQQRQEYMYMVQGYTFDAMELLLSKDSMMLSEFEVVKLTYRWCIQNGYHIAEFLPYFDFAMMSQEEKSWVVGLLPPTLELPMLVMNGLIQSSLVTEAELREYKLNYAGMRWKRFYSSAEHRLGLLLDSLGRALSLFHKKLILLRVDERLTVAIYVPQKAEATDETIVDDHCRLLAFIHSHDGSNRHRLAVPTKKNYRLYYDNVSLQLYETQRANSWVYIGASQINASVIPKVEGRGNRRRAKEESIERGENFDWRISVALDKFSRNLQRHIGRVRRNGILAAEIYVISNRDIYSQQLLDLWVEQTDTEETLPLFEKKAAAYSIPQVIDVDWSDELPFITAVVRDKRYSLFSEVAEINSVIAVFHFLWRHDERGQLGEIFDYLLLQLSLPPESTQWKIPTGRLFRAMVAHLREAPYVAITFSRMAARTLTPELSAALRDSAPKILRALILCANEIEDLMIQPFKVILSIVTHMELPAFAELIETICLAVNSAELALDLLLEGLERESSRILSERPYVVRHFAQNLIGIAMEHIDQAGESKTKAKYLFELSPSKAGEYQVTTKLRIDAPLSDQPRVGDHVRLTAAGSPQNLPIKRPYGMNAVVESGGQGFASFKCIHPPPPYFEDCSWRLRNCGSFVTARVMMDAVIRFSTLKTECCKIYDSLLDFPLSPEEVGSPDDLEHPIEYTKHDNLNPSQNEAVYAALSSNLTCLWGPPGTGKTHTICVILQELLERFPKARLLVATPTHNACDNVMQKYLRASGHTDPNAGVIHPLRLSTDVHKVVDALKSWTCDAMVGRDLNENPEARKRVTARLAASRLVFTTCTGAGLGLLRSEEFDIVIIDEASQQTEPTSMIPLVKGCSRAVLVGDHVQLRATVQQHAQLEMFDISLFERLYRDHSGTRGVRKVMLDIQYRMHQQICDFSSREFYEGKLRTGVRADERVLPESDFAWPRQDIGRKNSEKRRLVFIPCAESEDVGQRSKSNQAQARICYHVVKQLRSLTPPDRGAAAVPSIAILTPYTRQAELLRRSIPAEPVSSIDAFQGREADIIIFVTVRSNVQKTLGFLTDMRRLNVALTRAKTGLIIIGDRVTLSMGEDESAKGWKRLIEACAVVDMPVDEKGDLLPN